MDFGKNNANIGGYLYISYEFLTWWYRIVSKANNKPKTLFQDTTFKVDKFIIKTIAKAVEKFT